MATLQKIRSKGPLLVIVVGLALFAFIAGDAWRVFQPHQTQDVGEVDGESLSAMDYQQMVEEYSEIVKATRGLSSLTEEQTNQVRDEVWGMYVNNKLIEKEAEKLGLVVSNEEITAILKAGNHQILQQAPFRNPQTGLFDMDMLNKFLVEYAKVKKSGNSAYAEEYEKTYRYWKFLEKILRQSRLAEKYQALVSKAMLSNPVEAQAFFDGRVNQSNVLLAGIPYSSIVDSTVQVSDSEIKDLYNQRKETRYKQYVETRKVKYIDVLVTASDKDRKEIEKEVTEYTEQLKEANDYASFVRSTNSKVPYVDLYYTKNAFPADVVARIDSASVGQVYGPYYNGTDNTFNSFKIVDKAAQADSIEFRQIQVMAAADKSKALGDSIVDAIKGGAKFEDLAKKYGQTGASNWISSAQYEGAVIEGENLKYLKAINETPVNGIVNLSLGGGNIVLQVTGKKSVKDKYKIAVVKRTVDFSQETYNKAYNDFSSFIAANSTLDKLDENAENAGYRLLEVPELYSSDHGIGGIRGSKEALRWAYNAKPGEVSGLYECGEGNRMLVVGLVRVAEEGYRPIADVAGELRAELRKDKKAEKIMADMKAANATTWEQYKAMANAVSDSLKLVTFDAPAFVGALRGSEPLVGAYASVAKENQLSSPIKGNGGVFVVQVYGKENLNEEFNQKTEEDRQAAMHMQSVYRVMMNDLFLKAKVEDKRYLLF